MVCCKTNSDELEIVGFKSDVFISNWDFGFNVISPKSSSSDLKLNFSFIKSSLSSVANSSRLYDVPLLSNWFLLVSFSNSVLEKIFLILSGETLILKIK